MGNNKIIPSICEQEGVYTPELEPCDECDRLEAEFEQTLEDAQHAAADAQGYAEDASGYATEAATQAGLAEDAKEDADLIKADVEAMLEEARQILYQITGASINRFSQVFITTAGQSVFLFTAPGYEYSAGDYYSVYINGLKCIPSDFTKDMNEITLTTPVSLAGQTVEIVVDALKVEDESE